jgi:hypothetical protein
VPVVEVLLVLLLKVALEEMVEIHFFKEVLLVELPGMLGRMELQIQAVVAVVVVV